jgi:hypothetical protein
MDADINHIKSFKDRLNQDYIFDLQEMYRSYDSIQLTRLKGGNKKQPFPNKLYKIRSGYSAKTGVLFSLLTSAQVGQARQSGREARVGGGAQKADQGADLFLYEETPGLSPPRDALHALQANQVPDREADLGDHAVRRSTDFDEEL